MRRRRSTRKTHVYKRKSRKSKKTKRHVKRRNKQSIKRYNYRGGIFAHQVEEEESKLKALHEQKECIPKFKKLEIKYHFIKSLLINDRRYLVDDLLYTKIKNIDNSLDIINEENKIEFTIYYVVSSGGEIRNILIYDINNDNLSLQSTDSNIQLYIAQPETLIKFKKLITDNLSEADKTKSGRQLQRIGIL